MRLLSDDEARKMRCVEFSTPASCVGTDCHYFEYIKAVNIETGEEVTGYAVHNPNVTRLGICTKAGLSAALLAEKTTERG